MALHGYIPHHLKPRNLIVSFEFSDASLSFLFCLSRLAESALFGGRLQTGQVYIFCVLLFRYLVLMMSYAVWDSPYRLVLLAWEMPLHRRLSCRFGTSRLADEQQSLAVIEVGAGHAQCNRWFESVA